LATSQTLPENIQKKTCLQLVPEFPDPAWANPVNALAAKNSDKYCTPPTEKSDQDQVDAQNQPPQIDSNLNQNTNGVSSITLTATPQGAAGKTIASVEILIDGTSVASSTNTNYLSFDVSSMSGTHSVILRAKDSVGITASQNYDNVIFGGAAPIVTNSDIVNSGNLSCSNTNATNHMSTCNFSIPSGKMLSSSMKIQVVGSSEAGCSQSGNNVSCTAVQTPIIPGTYQIQVKSDSSSNYVLTGKTLTVTP
jgi:hypothetical protein